LIGDQPPPPDLPPQDSRARFHRVFKRFLTVFARPEHPLIWFIDDAQWLDAGTIELVRRLVTDPEIKNLLLICAFRDNDIRSTVPVTEMLKAVGSERKIEEIRLGPLSREEVNIFVAEALFAPAELVKSLSDLIFARTGGNPFFVTQILTVLEADELLVFDRGANTWRWDETQIASVGITENVADLMMGRVARLPNATLEAMKVLACLGNGVHLKTLSSALGRDADATSKALWQAVRPGLILQKGEEYAFAHDRVQEAAYRLIPDAERPATHLRIARALVLGLTPTEIEDRIFEIVDQFGRGRRLIRSDRERERAANLHLAAAKRAKGATAYASAQKYLNSGKALLDPQRWKQQYRLAFEFELQQAECEFLTGQHATAEKRLSALLARARDMVDRASAVCLLMALYTTLGDTDHAVTVGLSYLRLAGIEWSAHPTNKSVEDELRSMNKLLETQRIEQMVDLPRMNDATWLSVMEVLAWLILPALITDKNLEAIVLLRMTTISLQHGNCDASCYAYSQIMSSWVYVLGIFDQARDLGRSHFSSSRTTEWTASRHACTPAITVSLFPGQSTLLPAWSLPEKRSRSPPP
jgi:predicted ATPase